MTLSSNVEYQRRETVNENDFVELKEAADTIGRPLLYVRFAAKIDLYFETSLRSGSFGCEAVRPSVAPSLSHFRSAVGVLVACRSFARAAVSSF